MALKRKAEEPRSPGVAEDSKKSSLANSKPVLKSRPNFPAPISKQAKLRISKSPRGTKESTEPIVPHRKTNSSSNVVVEEPRAQGLTLLHSVFSKTGMSPDNPKKTNQDSYIEIANFAGIPQCSLFGVCDGHGQFGKEISNFVKLRLPIILSGDLNLVNSPKQAIVSSVELLQIDLLRNKFDTSFSGSTLNLVLVLNGKVYCANVGDSRAVIGRKEANKWTSVALSRDHKPEIEEEKQRIIQSGGRVEAYLDEEGQPYGPSRVWISNLDYPGIAMSRSLGDSVAASIGVISVPEISETGIRNCDKFIIIGSDGLFEFCSNDEIVNNFAKFWKKREAQSGCASLVRIAEERWKREEDSVDDITCVSIFLNN